MWREVVTAGLVHGGGLGVTMTVLVLAALRHDPMVFVKSAPRDVQAFLGRMSPASRRRKGWWVGAILFAFVATYAHLAFAVHTLSPGRIPTLELGVAVLITSQCFNLFDALVLDIGLVVLKPRWAFSRGSESLPGLRDPRWHLKNFFKGFVGSFVFAGLITLIAAGASRFIDS